MRELPSGTVTFLFTDIEGSTRLLVELGTQQYADALTQHRRVLRTAFDRHGGVEVGTEGDAFFIAFPSAVGAVAAAVEGQAALEAGPIRVRMGVHTGTPLLAEDNYVGADVHRAARIAAAGHGGQVLLSESTAILTDVERRDLGEHRLKDLAAPERIYQVGSCDFPPLKSFWQTNLPVPANRFLGREVELAAVVELLTGEARLVALTGPGGTGKTRLALEASAEAAEHFPGGITWLPLAPVQEPRLVLPLLVEALSLSNGPGSEALETLTASLGGQRRLLLLDNAEHLLPGVAVEIARLRQIEGPTVLVTTRERLQLRGEHIYAVPSLTLDDGVALFTARAQTLDPSFRPTAAVGRLCERLDRLPLALELAAARTVLFTTDQLLDRLGQRLDIFKGGRDADPRQQTLRATISWSHDLLAADEQQLFARLAVFVGGCSYEAAEQVCAAEPDALQSLLDKSLLGRRESPVESRFWMLESIHEFARGRLEEDLVEAEAGRARHAEYFAGHAEAASRHEAGGGDELAFEQANLRAALDWSQSNGKNELVLALLAGGRGLWLRGSLTALREELVLALAAEGGSDRIRAQTHGLLAHVAYRVGDYNTARLSANSELALANTVDDARLVGLALNDLANIDAVEGRFESARARFEQASEILSRGGRRREQLVTNVNLADLLLMTGKLEDAVSLCRDTLASTEIEDVDVRTTFQSNLATGLALLGRHQEAMPFARSAVIRASEVEDGYMLACILAVVALIAVGAGDNDNAAFLLGAADALRDEVGGALEPTETIIHRRVTAAIGDTYAQGTPASFDLPARAVQLLDEWLGS